MCVAWREMETKVIGSRFGLHNHSFFEASTIIFEVRSDHSEAGGNTEAGHHIRTYMHLIMQP